MRDNNKNKTLDLVRELGFVAAVSCGVGSIIGSGIFKKPALMASQLGSPTLLILVWVVAGVMTLFGTLSIAEIAGMFKDAGGQYVYFNKSYNRFIGFLYGWAVFAIIQTGSIASIAYVFSDSLGHFITLPHFSPAIESITLHVPYLGGITPFKSIGLKLSTIFLLLFLTGINYLGVRLGGAVQVIFTVLKVLTIVGIVVLAFSLGNGKISNLTHSSLNIATTQQSIFLMFIMAMSGAFWAYDGWINVTYMAGEIKNVQRNLPRAMAIAVFIVIAVYILVNLAYIYIIPVEDMAQKYLQAEQKGESYLVATDAANQFLGRWGGSLIALAIMISTFGAVNGTTMMSARVYFAMAREGLFFKKIGVVHPRYRTPGASLILQGIWASLLVMSGTFDQLTDMLIFVSWIFYAAGTLGVIVLRKRMPDHPRPYKVWGYPIVPWLFVVFASVYIVFTLYSDITNFAAHKTPLINSLMGIFLVTLGLPGYLIWNWKNLNPRKRMVLIVVISLIALYFLFPAVFHFFFLFGIK